ncbi:hypothetical protein D3C87_1709540 [compost metagenome]
MGFNHTSGIFFKALQLDPNYFRGIAIKNKCLFSKCSGNRRGNHQGLVDLSPHLIGIFIHHRTLLFNHLATNFNFK